MDEFSANLKLLLLSYEGYFSFGSYDGVVIDGKTTFLTLPYSFQEDYNTLDWAAYRGYLEIIKYLVARGANIHTNNDETLRSAAENGHLNVVKYVVEQTKSEAERQSGTSSEEATNNAYNYALLSSAWNGHLDMVKYLIARGADIHAENDGALRSAAHNGHFGIVKYLIEQPNGGAERQGSLKQGANIHANHNEALLLAARNNRLDMVKYLVAHGADIHAKNDSALRLAAGSGHLDVVKYLVEHGGRRRTSGPSSYRAQASVGTGGLSEATEASDVHAENDEALREALWYRHLDDVVDYLKNPKSYSRKYQIYKYLSR